MGQGIITRNNKNILKPDSESSQCVLSKYFIHLKEAFFLNLGLPVLGPREAVTKIKISQELLVEKTWEEVRSNRKESYFSKISIFPTLPQSPLISAAIEEGLRKDEDIF